jgi:hypothetical protein
LTKCLPCSEADKLEEQEGADGAEALSLLESTQGGDAAAGGIKQVDEKTNAVCVINATGTIQMANKVGDNVLCSCSRAVAIAVPCATCCCCRGIAMSSL